MAMKNKRMLTVIIAAVLVVAVAVLAAIVINNGSKSPEDSLNAMVNALNNLDFEMGVGELDLTSALIGESELEFGVGKTRLTFIGSQNDYSIDVDEGIGDIKIDGVSFSKDKVYGNGGNSVSIDGGVGSIDVFFQN